MGVAFFGPWYGEFGWELMTWQAWCRKEAQKYDKVYVSSFPDMEFLYRDFIDEFIPHRHPTRALDWTDISKIDYDIPPDVTDHIKPFKKFTDTKGQLFIKYGVDSPIREFDYLIHPRNIRKGSDKNYSLELWEQIARGLGGSVASIGSGPDWHVRGTVDLRGIPLSELVKYMAGCKFVIGQSSGVMHLATLCGAPIVVWGDSRTYFWQTLEVRYKVIWNPFSTWVEYISDDHWRPDPHEVLERVRGEENMVEEKITAVKQSPVGVSLDIDNSMAQALASAMGSGRWFITVSWLDEHRQDTLLHHYQTRDFPRSELVPTLEHLKCDVTEKEITPFQREKVEQTPVAVKDRPVAQTDEGGWR